MEPAETPVVFVHGLWLHATSWGPWVEFFQEAGYAPSHPAGRATPSTVEETRSHPEQVAGKGLNDVVEHYAGIIRGLSAPPIVIGHSFGGLIVQRLLGQNLAAAGVAIDAAPIKGVYYLPPSALRVASIALRKPANREQAVSLTASQFRYGFGNQLSAQESAELFDRWTVPSPGKPLFEDALANFTPRLAGRGGHPQQDPRPAAADRRRPRPHGPGGDHHRDPEAVPQVPGHHGFPGVPGPGALAHHRSRLARRSPGHPSTGSGSGTSSRAAPDPEDLTVKPRCM